MRPERSTEDVVVVLPVVASFQLCCKLPTTVLFQRFKSKGRNDHTPSALLCFWFGLDIPLSRHFTGNPCQNTPYLQGSCRKVTVLPFQCQQFAAPHAGCQSE